MLDKSRALTEQPSRMALVATGFGVGALAGVAAHLIGLGRWDLVPIGAGIGGGMGAVVAYFWVSYRTESANPEVYGASAKSGHKGR